MANLLSTIINGFISSKLFIPGFMGSGWKIWNHAQGQDSNGNSVNRYKMEIDDLVVRNTMTVFELLISKIRALKGALAITQANGKVKSVTEDPDYFYLEIEEEMSFVEYDIIRCQRFEKNKIHGYWVVVTSVEGNSIKVAKSEFDKSFITGKILNLPAIGDELVQFGNAAPEGALKYKNRRSAIYLSADESGLPTIDVLQGICTKSFEGCMKLRIGGLDGITDTDFPEGIKDFGIYCENGYFKGTIAGAGGYMLRGDGTGYICYGAIWWDKNKKVHFDGEVVLQWENLSEETRSKLKGEKGDPGRDANLVFPWLEEWNKNKTEIGGEYIISPKIFGGTKNLNTGKLTGVGMGKAMTVRDENGNNRTISGLFGIKEGKITFFLNADTGDAELTGDAIARAIRATGLNINDNFVINEDGTTKMSGSFESSKNGNRIIINEDGDDSRKITGYNANNVMTFNIGFEGEPIASSVIELFDPEHEDSKIHIRNNLVSIAHGPTSAIIGPGVIKLYDMENGGSIDIGFRNDGKVRLNFSSLPNSTAGLMTGDLYTENGFLKIK